MDQETPKQEGREQSFKSGIIRNPPSSTGLYIISLFINIIRENEKWESPSVLSGRTEEEAINE